MHIKKIVQTYIYATCVLVFHAFNVQRDKNYALQIYATDF